MWRYLILNNLWFAILFLVHFFGSPRSRLFILWSIGLAAAALFFRSGADPFAWLNYLVFSWLVFWSAGQFRRWALGPSAALDEEWQMLSKKLEAEKSLLEQKTREAENLNQTANEISHLYDKVTVGPSLRSVLERARGEKRHFDGEGWVAQPAWLGDQLFAALVVRGGAAKDRPLVSILTERFASELQRIRLYRHVETLATTDGLTAVYVRRHLIERLEAEMERSKRFGLKLSFLMVDVDDFKHFNDNFGHLVGDVVLRQVAETIKKNIREVDLVGRYGGEEFGVLLIETDDAGALWVAQRIRRSIEERIFRAYDESLRVTVSIGCAAASPALSGVSSLVEAADAALYRAKHGGRNRVEVAKLSVSP
ncbi:MAG: GGDEF domain-containing protein [Candidatus Omnitrophica bacterium]|nr:GGDEF domain-containing protein [Candidatus Omnitrophota bacterium]